MKGKLPKIEGKIRFNEPLFKHTTFHIGGPCKVWVEPRSLEDLRKILEFVRSKKRKIFIIGMGSNTLFRDAGYNGVAIHLGDKNFRKARFDGTRIIAGAGLALVNAVNLACKNGLKGLEGLVGIPGTVGGAIFMNAGYRGNISDCLEEVKVMDRTNGKIDILKRKNLIFGYRHSNLNRYIILEARFRLKKAGKKALLKRKNKLLETKKKEQPFGAFSAGCIFKNPSGRDSAARYIEILGLKGRRRGAAEISKKHANFIINLKNAKSRDVLYLMDLIKRRVKSRFNVKLAPEIIIV